jgi:hypothetical protein
MKGRLVRLFGAMVLALSAAGSFSPAQQVALAKPRPCDCHECHYSWSIGDCLMTYGEDYCLCCWCEI